MNLFAWRNRIGAWLSALALIVMASASNASWQCLDGRACPPGCAMTRHGLSDSGRACCHAGSQHCPLCPVGPKLERPGATAGCSSAICVLRVHAHPDALTSSASASIVDAPAALPLPVLPAVSAVFETVAFPMPPRAPPPQQGALQSSSPRAPPVLL